LGRRMIGRIADGATETSARLILLKDLEKEITAEELVLVYNGGEAKPTNLILGVIREGLGKNEFLSYTSYKPDVAYMRHGGEPSGSREVYSFTFKPIGMITDDGIEPNRTIIQPRSPVYMIDDSENPLEWLVKGREVTWLNAHLDRHPSWRVPVDIEFIPYHVGVYGSTGSGKSWLTRNVLIPAYVEAGYRCIVLDWSGTDYAPYYGGRRGCEVVGIEEIALDADTIIYYLQDKAKSLVKNDNVKDAFEEYVDAWPSKVEEKLRSSQGDKEAAAEQILEELKEYVNSRINNIGRADYRASAERVARRVFRHLKAEDILPLLGIKKIDELMRKAEENEVTILDMGGAIAEAKLSLFHSLSKIVYRKMERGQDVNIALIIDEAPQYAPWDPRGIQAETSTMIKNLAALGRKKKLNLTLISQGIRGEIGINAAVRRNLNTHFFGRIHPLDAAGEGGASDWLSPYGVRTDQLLLLKPGHFYFSGVMNPSPIPLLITFKPEEEL